jgi:hypothetical protein
MVSTQQVQAPGRLALRPVDPGVALPPLKSVRQLDQLRERIRLLHYSLRTEEDYVYWARAHIRFLRLRHPAEMGKAEVACFLTHLAAEKGPVRIDPSPGPVRPDVYLWQGTGSANPMTGRDRPAGAGAAPAGRRPAGCHAMFASTQTTVWQGTSMQGTKEIPCSPH